MPPRDADEDSKNMPEVSDDTAVATTYPSEELYESWREHADELDLTTSRFILQMVEAGRKQITLDDVASSSLQELRRRNEELQRELERQRRRAERLEHQLNQTEHTDMVSFVEKNPGASTPEIIQHMADTIPGRVAGHLDVLEGDLLERREGGYYRIDEDSE